MSKSRFDMLWDLAVPNTIQSCIDEVNNEFIKERNLHICDLHLLKKDIESFYVVTKDQLKIECYGKSANNNLDLHKLAAIFCAALIKYKPVVFKDNLVSKNISNKVFVINNYLINYKIAFYVAATICYYDLVDRVADDCKKGIESKKLLDKIIDMEGLAFYPRNKNHSPFENSFIIELARNDTNCEKFDYFSFALSMFQWQEYTRLQAKYNLCN